jgi:hypothetical protein
MPMARAVVSESINVLGYANDQCQHKNQLSIEYFQ